ncbi:hypothetical protein [Halogeometricum borinquense]|uniref:hypothetical protein n=1 Tax=Halogeometricum borinquense TaxID=60847 RepID=UPI001EF8711D|nr:hypothetical protein [Halogeometricum borinquense]
MSHERGSTGPQGASVPRPTTAETGVIARLKRHLRTWPDRYVEMRIGTVTANVQGFNGDETDG